MRSLLPDGRRRYMLLWQQQGLVMNVCIIRQCDIIEAFCIKVFFFFSSISLPLHSGASKGRTHHSAWNEGNRLH